MRHLCSNIIVSPRDNLLELESQKTPLQLPEAHLGMGQRQKVQALLHEQKFLTGRCTSMQALRGALAECRGFLKPGFEHCCADQTCMTRESGLSHSKVIDALPSLRKKPAAESPGCSPHGMSEEELLRGSRQGRAAGDKFALRHRRGVSSCGRGIAGQDE